MYRGGIREEHIQRVFSTGQLGRGRYRRLVPTRWTITAVQDILARDLMGRVKDFDTWDRYTVFHSQVFGNIFHVLYIPRFWSFEMVETWLKGAFWGSSPTPFSDYEGPGGRKTYASKVTGAYYAARLSVLDHLVSLGRQATVVIYREITSDYWAPLGVWVIREGVKEALGSGGLEFDSLQEAVAHISSRAAVRDWHGSSVLLRDVREQRRLDDFSRV